MKRILFSLLFLAAAFTGMTQTADEVINKHIAAIGGVEAWKKVNSIMQEGSLQVQGVEVNLTISVLHGKGMRTDIRVMGMAGFEILTPLEGWSLAPWSGITSPEAKTPEEVAESQDDLDAQGSLVDYASKGHTIELLGKDEVDGTECYKLKVNLKGGNPETIWIDAKNYYMVQSKSVQKANGQEMEVTTTFANYEKQPEGVVLPKSIITPNGELTVTKISINSPVDEKIFKN